MTYHSVELLLGTTARCRLSHLLICNVNIDARHGFSLSRQQPFSGHCCRSISTGIGIQHNVSIPRRHVHTSTPPGSDPKPAPLLAYYRHALEALLKALRQGDTFKLYFCLMRLVRSRNNDPAPSWCFAEVVASIPPTTFSEILRCFDPHNVSKEVDTAPGIRISYGAAVQTPLGELVNKWGVKLLYVRILNRLRRMQEARRHARIRPLLNDCVVLMRCAAATSDIRAAKEIWQAMDNDGFSRWRHSETLREFVKARYLTESIYANNDLARLRLRPLDLHRSTSYIHGHVRFRLKRLAMNIASLRKHRFGDNMHERYFAEPLTRILRKRQPLGRLWHVARLRGMFNGDERLLCAFMKANGRCARLELSNSLLKAYWGIVISRDRKRGTVQVSQGIGYPQDSPYAPTEHLLDAIVHCYCCMGQINLAVHLVDFVSRRFGISVPNKVWSDLLEYTRILQTKPAATEWRRFARFPDKGATTNTVLDVWNICTQEPHNFQPGMRDYYSLIRSFIRRSGSVRKPIEALRQVKPLYDDAVRAYEEAWCELLQTTIQHVPNHAAYRRYRMLRARKDHIWYCFHYASCQILKMIIPNRVDDDGGVREIPSFIGDFRQFMPLRIKYQVATGLVEFTLDNSLRRNIVEAQQLVEEPQPISQRPRFVDKRRDREEYLEDERDKRYWDAVEDHTSSSLNDLQIKEEYADGPEHMSKGVTLQKVEKDEAPDLEQKTSRGMFDGVEKDSLDGDQRLLPPVLDIRNTSLSTPGWAFDTQQVEKPAIWFRPPPTGPSTRLTMASIRRNGGEFTGYHDHILLRHFAAHQVIRTTMRVAGVPVDLGLGCLAGKGAAVRQKLPDAAKLAEQILFD